MSRVAAAAALGMRLLRGGGRRAWTGAALTGAGVVVGTALLAVALGALHGWDARETRVGWRASEPVAAGGPAVATVRVTTDLVGGRPLHRVDLADPRPDAPPPPGLRRMPAAGETWVSPALAGLLRDLPPDRLADRLPGRVVGEIGAAGLAAPGELVAVVGVAEAPPGAVPVDGFTGESNPFGTVAVYRQLTVVATVLIVFPVLGLVGAAARLTASRRTSRLATLRLLGASTPQVTAVAVTGTAAVAAVAAAAGIAAEWAAAPLLAAIPLAGSGWTADDLRPAPLVAAGAVLAVTLLGAASATGGMRAVVVTPLGVARRSRPGRARLVRLIAVVAGVAVFVAANAARRDAEREVVGLVFAVGMLALFGAVVLVGPLVVRVVGSAMARTAGSPARLLAGRRLLDDPRGAFRPLAGLTLAVFVAGFLAPLTAALGSGTGDDTALRVPAGGATPAAVVREAGAALRAAGVGAVVAADRAGALVRVGTGEDRDRVRTVLSPVAGGAPVLTAREASAAGTTLPVDLATGATIVLVATFLVAATSTGSTAAARVLDRRRTLRLLRLAGTPLEVLDAARRAETFPPLLVNGAIALVLGLVCAAPFAGVTGVAAPSSLVVLGGTLVAGPALVAATTAASRPLLRSVTEGAPRDDA